MRTRISPSFLQNKSVIISSISVTCPACPGLPWGVPWIAGRFWLWLCYAVSWCAFAFAFVFAFAKF